MIFNTELGNFKMILRRYLFSLVIPLSMAQQFVPLDIGEYVRNSLLPDDETLGGISSIFDKSSKVDLSHTGCGQKSMCEVLSSRRIGEDEDTGLQVFGTDEKTIRDAGLIRKGLDYGIDALRTFAAPALSRIGLGALARSDVSLFDVIVDSLDNMLIWGARFLAGRRFSRQIEDIAPLRSAINLVGPLIKPPTDYYPHLLDLAMDVTGLLDRDRGSYNYVRAGILGYAQGENGVCDMLQEDVSCESAWSILPPASNNRLGEIVQNRIYGRIRKSEMDAMVEEGFKWEDLAHPKILLCKIDTYLGLLNGHIDTAGEGTEFLDYDFVVDEEDAAIILSKINLEKTTTTTESSDLIDNDKDLYDFYDDEGSGDLTKSDLLSPDEAIRDTQGHKLIKKKIATRADKFRRMCKAESRSIHERNLRRLAEELIKNNATIEDLGNIDYTDDYNGAVSIDLKDKVPTNTNAEDDAVLIARTGLENASKQLSEISKTSIVIDKISKELKTESDKANFVYNLMVQFAPKSIENVKDVDVIKNAKSDTYGSLILTMKNRTDREKVLRAYRKYDKRSELKEKIRKPKLKDIELFFKN